MHYRSNKQKEQFDSSFKHVNNFLFLLFKLFSIFRLFLFLFFVCLMISFPPQHHISRVQRRELCAWSIQFGIPQSLLSLSIIHLIIFIKHTFTRSCRLKSSDSNKRIFPHEKKFKVKNVENSCLVVQAGARNTLNCSITTANIH